MPRGGYREGSGGKPSWSYGKTKVIRVPEALADKILEIARILDADGSLVEVTGSKNEVVTKSKVVNLSGISVRSFRDGPGIYLADLLAAGYEIEPERLSRSIKLKNSQEKQERLQSLKQEIGIAMEQLKLLED